MVFPSIAPFHFSPVFVAVLHRTYFVALLSYHTMMNSRILLFVSLFLTFAFSVVGWSVVINARVRSNQEISYFTSVIAQSISNAVVDINYHDIYVVSIILGVGCALLTIFSFVSTLSQIFSIGTKRPLFKRLQSYLMFFGALWVLATVIACDVLFVTRSSGISVTIGGIAVSQRAIQQIERQMGVSPEYKDKWYLRLCAILPWFAFLFATLGGLLLSRTARDNKNYAVTEETESEKIERPSDVKQV